LIFHEDTISRAGRTDKVEDFIQKKNFRARRRKSRKLYILTDHLMQKCVKSVEGDHVCLTYSHYIQLL
jgi:hypothetical protein